MEAYEVTRMVYTRLQAMEPEHVFKIIGYLLLHDQGDQEMLRLACSHDATLQAVVLKVKKELGLLSSSSSLGTAVPFSLAQEQIALSTLSPASELFHSHNLNESLIQSFSPELCLPRPLVKFSIPEDRFPKQQVVDHFSLLNERSHVPSKNFMQSDALSLLHPMLNAESSPMFRYGRRISTSDIQMPSEHSMWKPCVYYARGYCKHGSTCKFIHTNSIRQDPSFSLSASGLQLQDSGSGDDLMSVSSERLEMELQEPLRGANAPISIASLPQLYYERFGKSLQADGYLTESQRHGKAGYSLTKLLARLKNSVTLIDRPHGQHSVVLSEEVHKFTTYRGDKKESTCYGGTDLGSRQIYLTFPADSAFTEEDVSAHFRAYGPVQDVRIPFQQKRMFGFVTFVYPETVKMILAKGNPHFICGARVLVKPYKEKGKFADRKYSDRGFPRVLEAASPLEFHQEYDYIPGPHFLMEQDFLRRQLEEQERFLEVERRRFAEIQLEKRRQQFSIGPPSFSLLHMPLTSSSGCSNVRTGIIHSAVPMSRPTLNSSSYGIGLLVEETSSPHEEGLQTVEASSASKFIVDSMEEKERDTKRKDQEVSQLHVATTGDGTSDEHNLPDSPFTSPHKPSSPTPPSTPPLPDPTNNKLPMRSLSLDGPPPGFSLLSLSAAKKSLSCSLCKGLKDDPVELDCGHAFCAQCIVKVIRVSKDECLICRRHIGSQILKLIETRWLQGLDM